MSHRHILAALEDAAAGDVHGAVRAWRVHPGGKAARLVFAYALLRVMLDARGREGAARTGAALMLRALDLRAPLEPWDGPPLVPDDRLHALLDGLQALGLQAGPLLRWCMPVGPPLREAGTLEDLNASVDLPDFERAMRLRTIAGCDQPPLREPLREAFQLAVQQPVPIVRWCLLAEIAVVIRPWEPLRAQRMMQGILDELDAWADPDDRDTIGAVLLADVQVVLGTEAAMIAAEHVVDPIIAVNGLLQLAHRLGEAQLAHDQRSCLAHAVVRLLHSG